ncbi:MAG TPA: hypothetical protein VKK79_01660, partial [Candidatus Lokiarchaeia archaeon]|nr:hypothetical protein [Candidatus Lokiarchaeia archaeon]
MTEHIYILSCYAANVYAYLGANQQRVTAFAGIVDAIAFSYLTGIYVDELLGYLDNLEIYAKALLNRINNIMDNPSIILGLVQYEFVDDSTPLTNSRGLWLKFDQTELNVFFGGATITGLLALIYLLPAIISQLDEAVAEQAMWVGVQLDAITESLFGSGDPLAAFLGEFSGLEAEAGGLSFELWAMLALFFKMLIIDVAVFMAEVLQSYLYNIDNNLGGGAFIDLSSCIYFIPGLYLQARANNGEKIGVPLPIIIPSFNWYQFAFNEIGATLLFFFYFDNNKGNGWHQIDLTSPHAFFSSGEPTPTVMKGDSTILKYPLQNPGPLAGTFNLKLNGLDSSWYDISPSSATLNPGDSVPVTVTLHPPSIAVAGDYPFQVEAAAPDGSVIASASSQLTVSEILGPQFVLQQDISFPASQGLHYSVTIAASENVASIYAHLYELTGRYTMEFVSPISIQTSGSDLIYNFEFNPGPGGLYRIIVVATNTAGGIYWRYADLICYDDRPQLYPSVAIDPISQTILDTESTVTFSVQTSDATGISASTVSVDGVQIASEAGPIAVSYTIPSPRTPGPHVIAVSSTDSWDYWSGSQNSYTIYATINIVDDDPNPPTINSVATEQAVVLDNMSTFGVNVEVTSPRGIANVTAQVWLGSHVEYVPNPDGSGMMFVTVDDWGPMINASNAGDDLWQVTLPNPVIPGLYKLLIVAWDNDNDWPGDQMSATQVFTYAVVDDDVTPPVINSVSITGLNGELPLTDNLSQYLVTVNSSSSRGIATVIVRSPGDPDAPTWTYALTALGGGIFQGVIAGTEEVGDWSATVTVTDNDTDWASDQQTTTETVPFSVLDEEVVYGIPTPVITGVTFLDAVSSNPPTVLDNAGSLRVQVHASSVFGISLVTVHVVGTDYYYVARPVGGDAYQAEVPAGYFPNVLGTYTLQVTVTDNDADGYPGFIYNYDRNTISADFPYAVADDDVTPPVIHSIVACPYSGPLTVQLVPPQSSVPIPDTANYILVFINASDARGFTQSTNVPGYFSTSVDFGGASYHVFELVSGLLLAIILNSGTIGT